METQVLKETDKSSDLTDNQKITPFLWFDNNAEEAVRFYSYVFDKSRIKTVTRYGESGAKASGQEKGSIMTISFEIEGYEMVGINGGPVLNINPSLSFFINCDTVEEVDSLWAKLSKNGNIMMELNRYPFAEKYGWVEDKFGVSWQIITLKSEQKITPCLMFSGNHHLMAEDAINFYISVFRNSKINFLARYEANQGPEGAIVHCNFSLEDKQFLAMDSHERMPIDFTPGVSMVINCNTQEEIDYYWEKLTEGSDESTQQCGWLQDKFGFSWQVIPTVWVQIMSECDPARTERAMKAILTMKKIDIKALQKAIETI